MAQKGRRQTDESLILALACGATIEATAQKAGIGQTTVYRRLKEPELKQRLHRVRADMVERASGMLTAAAIESVKTLLELQRQEQSAFNARSSKPERFPSHQQR